MKLLYNQQLANLAHTNIESWETAGWICPVAGCFQLPYKQFIY